MKLDVVFDEFCEAGLNAQVVLEPERLCWVSSGGR